MHQGDATGQGDSVTLVGFCNSGDYGNRGTLETAGEFACPELSCNSYCACNTAYGKSGQKFWAIEVPGLFFLQVVEGLYTCGQKIFGIAYGVPSYRARACQGAQKGGLCNSLVHHPPRLQPTKMPLHPDELRGRVNVVHLTVQHVDGAG